MARLPETPYVGLTPFGERDAPFYFGRERERRLLGASILSSRLTLLYGASGVGKSSLLRAGLVPDFTGRASSAVEQGRAPESVLVVCASWRDDPLRALADAVEAAVRDQLGDLAPEPPPFTPRLEVLLAEWLRRLDERAAALAPGADEPTRSELLLVLDQFEEYFLYHPDEDGEGTLAFELPRAVMRDDIRVSFLVSIREDAYTQLDRFEGRIRNLFGSNFRLEHLDEPAARRAIEGPVERYNELLGDGGSRYAVEPALVDAVLGQVRAGAIALGQAGAGTVETNGGGDLRVATPFLQLVMTRLWEEELRAGSQTLRASTLERLGGAERLVRSHLDDALAELDERARDLTAAVFHQLVTPSGTKIVHTVPDLADYAGAPEPELLPVLEALAAARILRPVDPAPGDTSPRFEIFHDVLAPAILDWRAAHEQARAAREEAARQRRVRRRFAAAALGLLLLVLVFAGLAVWAVGQKRTAEENEAEAAAAADRAGSGVVAARAREVSYGPGVSALAGAEAYRLSPSLEARSLLLSSLHMNAAMPQILVGHSQSVGSLAFSPDGRFASASDDWTVRLWDKVGRPFGVPYTAPSETEVASVAFNEDGTLLAAAIGEEVHLFEVTSSSWRVLDTFPAATESVSAVVFVAGDLLASGGEDDHVRLWDVSDTRRPRQVADVSLDGDVADLAYNSAGGLLAAAGPEPSLWRVAASGELKPGPRLAQATGPAEAVAFSQDGKTLAAAIDDQIFLWKTSGATQRRPLNSPATILSVAFAGNDTLISGGWDDSVTVWDVAKGGVFGPPRTHAGDVWSIAVGPNGTIASGGDDTYIKLWSLHGRDALAATISDSLSVDVWDLAVGAGGLVAAATEEATSLWRLRRPSSTVRSREPVATIPAAVGSYAVAFSGTILAASDGDSVALWETGTDCTTAPREPCSLGEKSGADPVNALAFSRTGELLAAADDGGQVTIWKTLGRRTPLASIPAGESEPSATSVAFSRDGALLAASYYNGIVRLWNVRDPAHPSPRGAFKAQEGQYVRHVTFSPRGRLLAVGGGAETAELFDVRDPKHARRIEPPLDHDNGVWQLAFSPDGRVLATGSAAGDVRLWDVEARRPLGSPLPGTLPSREADVDIDGLAFAADGRLLSGGARNPVVAWDPALWSDDAEALRATACNLARQNLEAEQWEFFFQDTSIEDSRRKTCPEYPLPRG